MPLRYLAVPPVAMQGVCCLAGTAHTIYAHCSILSEATFSQPFHLVYLAINLITKL